MSAAKTAKKKGKSKVATRVSGGGRAKAKAAAYKEPGLLERLAAGAVICAEGYVFELERREIGRASCRERV